MVESAEGSAAQRFEKYLEDRDRQRFLLRLFVAGLTPLSLQAIANTKRFCEEHLAGRYELRVVDIYQDPEAAHASPVVAAPTLVRDFPLPVRLLIGDMSDTRAILEALDFASDTAAEDAQ